MNATTTIAGREIGAGDDVFVIAEAGVNHNGSVATAHELIDAAAGASADCVKFQTFSPERLVSAAAQAAPYQRRSGGPASQLELLRGLQLPDTAWGELQQHAQEQRLVFMSTPFDLPSAHVLAAIDVPAFKIGSGELTNVPFLGEVAALGKPVLLSTGMADLEEVRRALDATKAAPGRALFHCVSAYPAPIAQANLRAIVTMRDAFGVPVGWSDHTTGNVSALVAVALGARLIEKHITLDRALEGPDHAASLDPAQFRAFVADLRAASAALGSGRKERVPVEQENAPIVRRSWHVAAPVAQGAVITADSIVALRPEVGLPPWIDPVGRRAARDLSPGEPLRAEDMQ